MLKRKPLKTDVKKMRYQIVARWWNGYDYEMVTKEVDTKNKVIGVVKLLIGNAPPYQISITDTEQDHK